MKSESKPLPRFSSAEVRIRELDSKISKAKNKLEALKARKKVLVTKLRLITQALALAKRRTADDSKEADDISEMVQELLSFRDIPPNAENQDDIGTKLYNMTLDEMKD